MDELEIKGKKYISSKRASELTGYAKDYIGQLARSGKLPGMRMGRAWYVDADALLKQGKTETNPETLSHQTHAVEKKRIALQTPKYTLSPATFKALGYAPKALPNTWAPVAYFSDDSALIPAPSREEKKPYGEAYSVISPIQISDSLGTAVRIKILDQKIETKPVFRPYAQNVTGISKKVRHSRINPNATLALGALSAALVVFLFFTAGLFFPSNTFLAEQDRAYTANVMSGIQYAQGFLAHVGPYQQGIGAISSFFGTLGNSFVEFFTKGFQFLGSILNFLFGK